MEKIIVCSYDEKLLPIKKTLWAVCWDLRITKSIEVAPNILQIIWTGIKTFIPHGWHAKVYARSWLPSKMGLVMANSVAVFDADYRGEYMIQLLNFQSEPQTLEKYTRITQMEFQPYYYDSGKYGTSEVPEIEFVVDKDLYDHFEEKYPSVRGTGRFNSTGTQ